MTKTEDRWAGAVRSFQHTGPGGDAALEAAYPDLVRMLRALAPGEPCRISKVRVTRQRDGDWQAGDDRNLASPWSVVQSVRSATLQ